MSMKQNVLIGILALQLVIVGGLWFYGSSATPTPEEFLQFEQGSVDRFIVRSPDGSIEISKTETGWALPDGNPADETKVDTVLEKLADVQADWPVATTQSAATRFEVTADKFQKHVTVYAGTDLLADVYLGTSPSFRKVHARHAKGGDVYSIEFSNHEAGITTGAWLDRSLLRPEGAIESLELVDRFRLQKVENQWTSTSGENLDESKVRSYMDRFESLNVFEISEKDVTSAEESQVFKIEDDAGTYTLSVYHFVSTDDWVATTDRRSSYYGLVSYQGKELFKELSDLMPEVDESESETSTETEESNPEELE